MGIDIAIDLGTSRTRIFLPDKGVVVDEPSVITVDLMTDAIIAVGQKPMKCSEELQSVCRLCIR